MGLCWVFEDDSRVGFTCRVPQTNNRLVQLPTLLVISDLVWSLQVISIKDGMPTWICEICVTAPTTEEAIEYVKKVETELQLDIQ